MLQGRRSGSEHGVRPWRCSWVTEPVRARYPILIKTKNKILNEAGSNRATAMQAVDILVTEGFVMRVSGPNKGQLHTSSKVFRAALDPANPDSGGFGTT